MPLVSNIVEIEGLKMLDGGIADSIPLRYFQEQGYKKNIVVLTRPKEYRKGPNKLMSIMRLKYKPYPKLLETMANRHNVYNETLEYIESETEKRNVLVIRPDYDLPLSKVEKDPEKLKKVYEIGRAAALEKIDEIKSFLE